MTLPVTNLDDRSFQQIVDEAKRRIPDHCKEWTNHNVADPGVALIELFAWMTEMTLFRLNQVPDVFYTHMLNLVGFQPFPATAARAQLTFWLVAPVGEEPRVIPAGTQVSTVGTLRESRVFTTLDDRVITKPELIGALTSVARDTYVDVWDDLRVSHRAVVCFPNPALPAGDAFYLAFRNSLAGNVVELHTTAYIEGIGVKPRKPPLAWEVWQGDDSWAPAVVDSDTTGGLNTDGVVTLLIPPVHQPATLSGLTAHWLRAKLLPPEPDQPKYKLSPQIRSMRVESVGCTALAEHSEQAPAATLGVSNGRPDQRFQVELVPVMKRSLSERVTLTSPDGAQVEEWDQVDDFIHSAPDDEHYTWDSTTGTITFGPEIRYPDGTSRRHGRIPPEGWRVGVTGYRHGGGTAGNVGPRTLVALRSTLAYVARVENRQAATGGVDAETVANAKLRGPQTLRAGARAVTAADYERLAEQADPAIARVRCLPPPVAGKPVRLLLVPKIDRVGRITRDPDIDEFALGDPMVKRVSEFLDARRVLGTTLEIGTPYYQGVTVAARIIPQPGRPPTYVHERVLDALYAYVDPLTGGLDGKGWPFDRDLNVATVRQLVEAVEGVERADDVLLFEYDLRNDKRVGGAKDVVRLEEHALFVSAKHQVVIR
jgi:predicted phage baseplate assembly protein